MLGSRFVLSAILWADFALMAGAAVAAPEDSTGTVGVAPSLTPRYGRGPVYPAGEVRCDEAGVAFTVPEGWVAERHGSWWSYAIAPLPGGAAVDLSIERYSPFADAARDTDTDSLITHVKRDLNSFCAGAGPDGVVYADSVLAIAPFDTDTGAPGVEFFVRVRWEWRGGVSLVQAGPFYVVHMNEPGSPLWIVVRGDCNDRAEAEIARGAAEIVKSLRRL